MKSLTTKSKLRVVQKAPASYSDLESRICDLDRAARIAFLITMHDAENEEDEDSLGLFAVEQVERLAAELREAFYRSTDGEGVQS